MNRFYAWFERLSDEGTMKSGRQLAPEGKLLSSKTGVTDGPFADSKEAIAGYWFIYADSFEKAVEIAKGSPGLEYGNTFSGEALGQIGHGLEGKIEAIVEIIMGGATDFRLVGIAGKGQQDALAEGQAIAKVFGTPGPAVTSIKGITGHSLGAAGSIEAVALALGLTIREQVLFPVNTGAPAADGEESVPGASAGVAITGKH